MVIALDWFKACVGGTQISLTSLQVTSSSPPVRKGKRRHGGTDTATLPSYYKTAE